MSTISTIAGMTFWVLMCFSIRVEPRVGHRHDADVGIDRAERIVRGLGLAGGERVEDRALAHVGQADDTDGECHGSAMPTSEIRHHGKLRADALRGSW